MWVTAVNRYNLLLFEQLTDCKNVENDKVDLNQPIGHFTVVYSVTRPMNGSEAAGDLVSIQTPLFLSCKSCSCDANWPSFA